jgi:hypothetical protein
MHGCEKKDSEFVNPVIRVKFITNRLILIRHVFMCKFLNAALVKCKEGAGFVIIATERYRTVVPFFVLI